MLDVESELAREQLCVEREFLRSRFAGQPGEVGEGKRLRFLLGEGALGTSAGGEAKDREGKSSAPCPGGNA